MVALTGLPEPTVNMDENFQLLSNAFSAVSARSEWCGLEHRGGHQPMTLVGHAQSALELRGIRVLHVARPPHHQRVRAIVNRLAEGVAHANKQLAC